MTDPRGEVVTFANDKNRGGLPKELSRRRLNTPPRPPALWSAREVWSEAEGTWGAYPKGFVGWACAQLQVARSEVLHLCSGSVVAGDGRVRVDIRREVLPDVAADATALPFPDGIFAAALIDPPYSVEYAADLYGTEYPRPSHLLREASRVVRPCGRIGIMHFIVPMPPPGCQLEKVYGVTTGCGYRIRAFTLFLRDQDSLFQEGSR